ncbi:MAG: YihY/virulence factor BrkB family protein [Oscillospiraceae bacterium]|nr:YihY/virulence factor BrkB family protein [Oscillospiraceae bacterium]MBQ5712811.1 YihY/virulence factor BrkB family protein [Oscillospiraceae bacterium]
MGRIRVLWRRIAGFLEPMEISLHGAYTTFYIILSVFPVLVILFAILGHTAFGLEEFLPILEQFIPEAFLPMVMQILEGAYEHSSGTVLSVSALSALWSASRGVLGLLRGLDAVFGLREGRSYLRTRGLCMLYTFLFLLVLVLTLVLHVFGTALLDYLRMTTQPLLLFLMDVIDLRYVLLLGVQTALFTAMYACLPDRRHRFRQCLPGALVASVGWIGFSKLFSLYVEHFPSYANIYGSVYAVALAMLWLFCCVCIIFYGAALDRWLMERRKR